MSLDVYLESEEGTTECICPMCDNTHTKQVIEYLFEWNITHNLSEMADKAGLYEYLWRPEDNGIEKASQLIEPLRAGLKMLMGRPDNFKKFNPKNGWGTYELLVEFVRKYLRACKDNPDATVRASR